MRKALLAVHRYLGLTLAGFLIISGITGSFLAFYAEFDALLNPTLYRIEQSDQGIGQKAVSAGELIHAVEEFNRHIRVYYLPINAEPRRASVVYVEPVIDPTTGRPYHVAFDEVFINPLTAEVTGARMWGECCGPESILPIMHKLHNRLFLPTAIGRPLWGFLAILWSIMAVIGLILTWPASKAGVRQWTNAWKLRRGLPSLPKNINLHKATGLWFWLIILPVALSGVALGLERQVFVPMVQLASAWFEDTRESVKNDTQPTPVNIGYPVDDAITRAQDYARSYGINASISGVWYDHESGLYEIEFGPKDKPGIGDGSVSVSTVSGLVSGHSLAGFRSFESIADSARERVHSGRIIGLPGRVLVFLCGWAVALLSITGVIIWFKRRSVRSMD